MTSKQKRIAYWSTTLLFTGVMGAGGVGDLLRLAELAEVFLRLGYPPYLMTLLGVCKLAGVATLLAPLPRASRLREWAYAGFFFDLMGATVSHVAVGDGVGDIVKPMVLLVVMLASYTLQAARSQEA